MGKHQHRAQVARGCRPLSVAPTLLKKRTAFALVAMACLAWLGAVNTARAAGESLRIGVIASYSGPYADYGRQFDAGIALYLKEHGGRLANRTVEVIKRDTAGPAPSGVMPPAFLRTWKERGMERTGIKLYATGEATDDSYLDATGDVALGLVTAHHYSYAHPSPKNRKFAKDFRAEFGTALRPSYFAVAAYDAMAAIDLALARTRGDASGTVFMEALKGLNFESPRGPIQIDPVTRDIVQTVYIRRTERVGDKLVNVEFDSFDRVRDPAKEAR